MRNLIVRPSALTGDNSRHIVSYLQVFDVSQLKGTLDIGGSLIMLTAPSSDALY